MSWGQRGGHPGDLHGGATDSITLPCRAAGITRRVPSVTSANSATMVMRPGAPRVTVSPVPAMDLTVTLSRCHSLVPYFPGDTGKGSPIPLSPLQGDQDLL